MSLKLIRKDNHNEYRIGDQSYFLILDVSNPENNV